MTTLFPSHRRIESLREGRLIYQQMKRLPENPPESPTVRPEQQRERASKMLADLTTANPPDQRGIDLAVHVLGTEPDVFALALEQSRTLPEQQRVIITQNLEHLKQQTNETEKEKRESIERIRREFAPAPKVENPVPPASETTSDVSAAPATAEAVPPATSAAPAEKPWYGRLWDGTKEKATAGWERTKEFAAEHPTLTIAAGSTLGVIFIYKLWKWWRGEKKTEGKKEEKPAEKESTFWKIVKWIPGLGLMALAGWGIYEGVQWMRTNLTSWDQAKRLLAAAERRIKAGLGFERKKYGLSDQARDEAEKIFDTNTEANALPQIRLLFGLPEGGTSPQFEEFVADMRKKYRPETPPGGTVVYQRVDVALMHYEQDMELGILYLLEWIKTHPAEEIIAGAIAAKLGVLRHILEAAESAAQKAVKITLAMTEWGFKELLRHPFFSLFAVGGGILAARRAVAPGKEIRLPQNLQALGQACVKGEPLVLGLSKTISGIMDTLRDHAKNFAEAEGKFGPWVEKQLGSFIKKADEVVAGVIGRTDERILEDQDRCGLHSLQFWLKAELGTAGRTEGRKEEVPKFKKALEALKAFEEALVAERDQQETNSDKPERAYEALKLVLQEEEIDVTLEESGGIVRWMRAGELPQELCIDPHVRSRQRRLGLADDMRPGEQNALNYFAARLGRYINIRERQAKEQGKKWLFSGSDTVAMVLGNSLYFMNFGDAAATVFWVPLKSLGDVATAIPGIHYLTGHRWSEVLARNGSDLLKGFADTALLSIPVVLFSRLKRLAMGGGYVFKPVGGWAVFRNVTPGVAEYFWGRNAYRGFVDAKILKYFTDMESVGKGLKGRWAGYWRGKRLNSILARAVTEGGKILPVRAEWIGILETATTPNELSAIAAKYHLPRPDLTKPVAEICANLRKSVIDMLKKSRIRQLSGENWGVRLFGTSAGIDKAYDAYNDALRWYWTTEGLPGSPPLITESMVLPSSLPITPPPLPGASSVPPPLPLSTSVIPPPLPNQAAAQPPSLPKEPGAQPPPLSKGAGAQPPPLPESKPAASTVTATETPSTKLTPADRGVTPNAVPGSDGAHALEGQPEGVRKAAQGAVARDIEAAAEHSLETLESLKTKVQAARKAGDHAEVARLLTENRAALKAAEGTDEEAKALLRALEGAEKVQLKWVKFVGPGLVGLGVLADALLVTLNEWEISHARQEGNAGLAEVLLKKRQSLVGAGVGGLVWGTGEYALTAAVGAEAAHASIPLLSVGSAAAPGWLAGGVLAVPVVWASIHSGAVFEAVQEWNKNERAYLAEDGAALLGGIQRKETERTAGQGAAYGDRSVQWLWKRLTWSEQARTDYYQKMYESSEHINRNMREKMYSAYFLQYTQPLLVPGDLALAQERTRTLIQSQGITDVQKQQELFQQNLANVAKPRVQEAVAAKRHFLQSVLACDFWTVPPLELAKADAYAELAQLRQQLQKQGKPLTFRYRTANGEDHMLDLAEFGKSGDLSPEVRRSIQDVVLKYHEEAQVTDLFRKHFQKSALIDAADGSQKEVAQSALRHDVRADVLHRIRHSILRAEQRVRDSALPAENKDVVRLQLKHEFEEEFNAFMTLLSNPASSYEDYHRALHGLELLWENAKRPERIYQRNTSALKEAIEHTPTPVYTAFGVVDARAPAIHRAKSAIPAQELAGLEHLLDEVDAPQQTE